MLLFNRDNWPWFFFFLAAIFAVTIGYFVSAAGMSEWPGGSSFVGFLFGVIGGLIIIFEFLLWPRKMIRVRRLGRAQTWMRAHIWLGLLTLPLLICHSGFRLGGTLSTVLMVLLVIVVVSGIAGLVAQHKLPRRLLNEVPRESIYSQIGHVTAQLGDEAERLVLATCGPAAEPELAVSHEAVAIVRSAGRVQGQVLQTRMPSTPVPGTEPLRDFFYQTVVPFLLEGAASHSSLRYPDRAVLIFRDLRARLDPAAHATVTALEDLCDRRRQFDHQARLHFWLHSWLWVHLALSGALLVLMFVHAWEAMKYW